MDEFRRATATGGCSAVGWNRPRTLRLVARIVLRFAPACKALGCLTCGWAVVRTRPLVAAAWGPLGHPWPSVGRCPAVPARHSPGICQQTEQTGRRSLRSPVPGTKRHATQATTDGYPVGYTGGRPSGSELLLSSGRYPASHCHSVSNLKHGRGARQDNDAGPAWTARSGHSQLQGQGFRRLPRKVRSPTVHLSS